MTTYSYQGVALAVHETGIYHEIDCNAVREVQRDYFWDVIDPLDLRWVLDIGAHIGSFSVFVASRNPHVNIVAIEPEVSNFNLLSDNVAPFNVLAFYAFVGYSKSLNTIEIDPCNSGGHRITADGNGKPAPSRTTLERLIGTLHIDLLKIDCEGCECDVLLNCTDEVFSQIDCIVGERHQTIEAFNAGIGARLAQWYTLLDRPNPETAERGVFLAVRKQ